MQGNLESIFQDQIKSDNHLTILKSLALIVTSLIIGVWIIFASRWVIWVAVSALATIVQLLYASYELVRISIDILLLAILKFTFTTSRLFAKLCCNFKNDPISKLKKEFDQAESYAEFCDLGTQYERLTGVSDWLVSNEDLPQSDLIEKTIQDLQQAIENQDSAQLKFLLAGLIKRNHLGMDDIWLQSKIVLNTKKIVETYQQLLIESIHVFVDSNQISLEEKLQFLKRLQKALGRTALCLSGGGAIAMNHLGVILALIETNLYKDIKVMSGASGGSIVVAMLAGKTQKELLTDVCVNAVSTDFCLTGEMQKQNIRWFPPVMQQVMHYLKHGVLLDSKEFYQTCVFYYKDMTFEEAYTRTKKHVSITVSASRLKGSHNGPQRLLLNHITTPHVTLASAVAASCALPGIMKPQSLMAKNQDGKIEPFQVDGVEWIDGSIEADVPFRRISTLFSISNFIVSQTNFHVVPFIRKSYHPSMTSLYWKIFSFLDFDVRIRAQRMARFNLMPKFFGQDIGRIFKQKYYGNITIVPSFTITESLGLKAIVNPSKSDIDLYIKKGKKSTYPSIARIREAILIESAIDSAIEKVKQKAIDSRNTNHQSEGMQTIQSLQNDNIYQLNSTPKEFCSTHTKNYDNDNEEYEEYDEDAKLTQKRTWSPDDNHHIKLLEREVHMLKTQVERLEQEKDQLRDEIKLLSSQNRVKQKLKC